MVNETQEAFNELQVKSLSILNRLVQFLEQGDTLGLDINPYLKEKLTKAIQKTQNEKLKIVLIGGYSEGKTSIIAAWLGKKEENMNISNEESTNDILFYQPDDNIELVDTPGLYGFKEKNINEKDTERYKDVTKKYISEAHLVLYVMNPSNPIKASHKSELQWLFRDLNLLSRTIFVISKFDEIADIEDDEEYKQQFSIVRNNVITGLQHTICLHDDEAKNIILVAVATNPFGKNIEYWLNDIELFKQISHIDDLQSATTQVIKRNGSFEKILQETQKSIIADVLCKQIPEIEKQNKQIESDVKEFEESTKRISKDIEKIKTRISNARNVLRDFASEYFTAIIMKLEGTSLDTFTEFFEKNIGSEGILLNTEIEKVFEREIGSVMNDIGIVWRKYDEELSEFNNKISTYGKHGIKFLQSSNLINPQNIKYARDIVASIGNIIGINLNKYLKFQPWGAIKLAKGANAVLAAFNLALEAYDSYQKQKREEEFREVKINIKSNLEKQRKEMLEMIKAEDFIDTFFSDYIKLEEELENIENTMRDIKARQQDFIAWKEEGETIEREFREIIHR